MNKIKALFYKLKNEFGKFKYKRYLNKSTALALAFIALAEPVLTGMTFNHEYTICIYVDGVAEKYKSDIDLTVKDVLDEKGIILGEYDEISVPADTAVYNGMTITVDRVEYIDVSKSETVEYETVYEESSLYEIGTEFVSQEGQNGCIVTTSREKIVNGVLTESVVISTQEYASTPKIITEGTALSEPYSKKTGDFTLKNGAPTEFEYVVSGKVTAYTAPEGSGTYSGRKLEIGTVAVNPDIIPFGSELYICSKDGKRVYGYAVAADTGDLTEVVADVYMGLTSEHYADACAWGAQDANVYVLKKGDNSISWL